VGTAKVALDKIVSGKKTPERTRVQFGTPRHSYNDIYMTGAIGSKGCEKFSAALENCAFNYFVATAKFWYCRWPTLCSKLPRGGTCYVGSKSQA
jgi:hypothetical protein